MGPEDRRTGHHRPTSTNRCILTADGAAFPSGHATNAATAATLVLIAVWPWLRTWTGRIAAIGVAAAWAAVVGLSRVAGGVHWPTDVLGGWLLSMTVVTAALAALVGSAARAGDAR